MKPSQRTRSQARRAHHMVSSALAALVLTACASSAGIAPVAQRLDPQSLGLSGQAQQDVSPQVSATWWRAWGDPALSELMDEALAAHPSLQVAQARVAKASALVDGQRGAGEPKLGAKADATRQRFSANSIYPPPLGGSTQTLANAQLGASWELDFFGRHRADLEAAIGAQRAAQADLAAARNLLSANVAQTYVQLGHLLSLRDVAKATLEQRQAMLDLIRQRVSAGLDTQVELRQGEGALPETRQAIEQLNEQITTTRHALAALTAAAPDRFDQLVPHLDQPALVAAPAVVPADLLGRRADIQAARWRIEAATRSVDAAKAQFYPNVNLSAFVGLSSIGLNKLLESGSRQYGVGPAISLPIFDAGALRANLGSKTAGLDAAVAAYNGAVIDAVRETADQLASLQSIGRQTEQQREAQSAAESAYSFARQRYAAGLSGYLTLLNAENAVLAQRRQAVDLRARALSAQVGLVRALGGGYMPDASPAFGDKLAAAH
jgi:NodT family efflux transporter outer membrane factor (OMF) lipoprotein